MTAPDSSAAYGDRADLKTRAAAARRGSPPRLRPANPLDLAGRLVAAGLVTASGYIHLDLYLNNGYRYIPKLGTTFLIQESGSFAVALLLIISGSWVLRLLAAGLEVGALGGFVMSRTVGVFGFTEHGLNPAPQALLSILVEIAALVVLAIPFLVLAVQRFGPGARVTSA